MIDWQKVAPKRADWERLSKAFSEAGLPSHSWVNGEPVFTKKVDEPRVQAVVDGVSSFASTADAAPAQTKKKSAAKAKKAAAKK